jgi:hypothetical protein
MPLKPTFSIFVFFTPSVSKQFILEREFPNKNVFCAIPEAREFEIRRFFVQQYWTGFRQFRGEIHGISVRCRLRSAEGKDPQLAPDRVSSGAPNQPSGFKYITPVNIKLATCHVGQNRASYQEFELGLP